MGRRGVRIRVAVAGFVMGAQLAAPGPGTAQVAAGVKAGVSVTSFSGSTFQNVEPRLGYLAGLFATYRIVDELSLQVEGLYAQKGAGAEFLDEGTKRSAALYLDYLELGGAFRVDLPIIGGIAKAYAFAGPAAALNVRCEVEINGGRRRCEQSTGMDVRAADFSMTAGGGAAIALRDATIILEARISAGLGTVDSESADWQRTNQGVSGLAGFSLPAGTARRPR